MVPLDFHHILLLLGALAGYLVLMLANPVRASLRDGFRCVRRYKTIWLVLFTFSFCYAAFQLALRIFFHFILPEGDRPIFLWSRAWFLPHAAAIPVLQDSCLPALESVAGIFNNIVTTYPFSAAAAVLLLVNWGGHYGVVYGMLRKRFGVFGLVLHIAVSLCAVAAIAKPFVYGMLPLLKEQGLAALQVSLIVDWLSFLFEYLFGVCIQIYLILMAYAWVRGMTFTHAHLLDFAIRRFGFVMKWACVVLLLSTAFIHLPLIIGYFPPFSTMISPETALPLVDRFARPFLAGFLILFGTVQITLTFHSESLLKAIRAHFAFAFRNLWAFAWFLVIAMLHFFILTALNKGLVFGLGEGTAFVIVWELVYPIFSALVAGWFLAAWVCLFRRCDSGRIHAEDWIKF